MRKAILLVTAMAIAAAPACSYMTVVGPPPPQPASAAYSYGPPGAGYAVAPRLTPSCTVSKVAPIIDTVIAALYIPTGVLLAGVGGAVLLGENDRNSENALDRHGAAGLLVGMGIVSVLFGIPWALSASSGYRDVNACRAARGY